MTASLSDTFDSSWQIEEFFSWHWGSVTWTALMIHNSCDGFNWVFVKAIANNDISTSKCSAYLLQEYAWCCSLRKEMFLFRLLCVPLFLWLHYLQKNIAECSGAKIVQLKSMPHNSIKAFLSLGLKRMTKDSITSIIIIDVNLTYCWSLDINNIRTRCE